MKARKMFVGGIGGATEQDIYTYFSKFGGVEDYFVQRDPMTGGPKGFAFVVFQEATAVEAVLQQAGSHTINGKNVDCKNST